MANKHRLYSFIIILVLASILIVGVALAAGGDKLACTLPDGDLQTTEATLCDDFDGDGEQEMIAITDVGSGLHVLAASVYVPDGSDWVYSQDLGVLFSTADLTALKIEQVGDEVHVSYSGFVIAEQPENIAKTIYYNNLWQKYMIKDYISSQSPWREEFTFSTDIVLASEVTASVYLYSSDQTSQILGEYPGGSFYQPYSRYYTGNYSLILDAGSTEADMPQIIDLGKQEFVTNARLNDGRLFKYTLVYGDSKEEVVNFIGFATWSAYSHAEMHLFALDNQTNKLREVFIDDGRRLTTSFTENHEFLRNYNNMFITSGWSNGTGEYIFHEYEFNRTAFVFEKQRTWCADTADYFADWSIELNNGTLDTSKYPCRESTNPYL